MGLCLCLFTLVLVLLGILNWIFRFSRESSFAIKSHCTFPRVSQISTNLLAAALWYPNESAQFVLNSSRAGSVAVQWEGPCTLAKLSLGVLASETSIFRFILKCWNVQHDCCVLQNLKFSRGSKVSLASLMKETFWLQSELPRGVDVLAALVSPLPDPFCAPLEISSNKGRGWKPHQWSQPLIYLPVWMLPCTSRHFSAKLQQLFFGWQVFCLLHVISNDRSQNIAVVECCMIV